MGCCKSIPIELVGQPMPDSPPLVDNARCRNGQLELNPREATKSDKLATTLSTHSSASGSKVTTQIYECDGRVIAQVTSDYDSFPSRDPVITIFDSAGKTAVAIIGSAIHYTKTGRGKPVMYAKNAPDLSNGASHLLVNGIPGLGTEKVDATKTTADGTVLHATGQIRPVGQGGNDVGFFPLLPNGTFADVESEALLVLHSSTDGAVVNARGEMVASLVQPVKKQVVVAAGVDVALVLALVAYYKLWLRMGIQTQKEMATIRNEIAVQDASRLLTMQTGFGGL